jgi:hypothetical protein
MRPRPQFRVAPCCRLRQSASLASRGRGLMHGRPPQRLVTAVHHRYRWRACAGRRCSDLERDEPRGRGTHFPLCVQIQHV